MPTAPITTKLNQQLRVDVRSDGIYLGDIKLTPIYAQTNFTEALNKAKSVILEPESSPTSKPSHFLRQARSIYDQAKRKRDRVSAVAFE